VGEHRNTKLKKTIKKGPLLFATAFFVFSPICTAEAATSSFEKSPLSLPSGLNAHSTPYLTGSKQLGQTQSLPKSYRDLLSLASILPSIEDLNTLKSTLSRYENQLKTLKISEAKDPKNASALSKAITDVEDSISDLKNKISTLQNAITALKNTQFSLTEASKTLSTHQTALNTAKTNETNALTALGAVTADKTVKDSVKASSKASLDSATETYNSSLTQKELSDAALTQQQEAAAQALQTLNKRQTQASTAAENLTQALQTLNEASSNLAAANASKTQAQAELDAASSKLQTKQSEVSAARETYNQVTTQYNETLDIYTTVYNEYLDAQETVNITRTNLQEATNQLNQAQSDYDNLLIPDPTWTPATYQQEHTRQVPHTVLVPVTTTTLTDGLTADSFNRQNYSSRPPLPTSTEIPIATQIVPNINFQWGGGNVLNSGKYDRVLVRFTGNISFPTSSSYQFYSPADDGTMLYIDGVKISDDWRDKGGGGSTSASVYFEAGSTHTITLYFYENGGGANVWLYYATPTTGFQIVPAEYLGTVATTTTTYVEQTTYTTETYYTTEEYPNQSAPLIHNPDLLPNLHNAQIYYDATVLANQQAEEDWQIAQDNQQQAARDSLAAYYLLIDTATTLNALSSELDVDQNAFNQAQSEYDQATNALTEAELVNLVAQQTFNEANSNSSTATSQLQTAAQNYNAEVQKSQAAQTSNEALSLEVISNKTILDAQQQEYNKASTALDLATSNEASLQLTYSSAQEATTEAQSKVDSSTSTQEQVQEDLAAAETLNEASFEAASGSSSKIQPLIDVANEILNQPPAPLPEPEPEPEGSAEIPAVIENLMDVDLNKVDPTELTEAQAEQLVEAALEAFETATEGSPEYEQALDALALAAQQDDIQVDPSLASIPGVGQAAQAAVAVLNAIGNLGADISPKVRKKAQTLVVTTLVVGQIAQTAALATASSGGSSNRTTRRK
jgi:hypothetical protein